MTQGVWVTKKHLVDAGQVIRKLRIHLEGAESWLGGDDMVIVRAIWDRDRLEQYIEYLGQLEDTYVGLLALCEEVS